MMTAGERRKKQMNEEENAIRQQGMPGMGDSYKIVMQQAASAGTNRPSDSARDEQMMHRDKLMGTLGNIRQQENDFTQYVDNALKSLGEQQSAQIGQTLEQGRLVVDLKPTAAMQYVDQNSAKSRANYNQQGMQRISMQKQQVAQGQAGLDHNVKAVQKQQVAQAQSGLDRNVKGMQKQQITQGQGGLNQNVQVMQQKEEQAHNRAQQIEAQRERAAAAQRWRRRTKGSVVDALVNIEMATEGTELNEIFKKYDQGRISQANFEAAKDRYIQKLKSDEITYYDKIDETKANFNSKKTTWEHLYLGVTPEIAEKAKSEYDEALARMNIFYDQLKYLSEHKEELKKVYGDVTLDILSSYYSAKAKSARVGNTEVSSELDKMIFNYGTEIKRLGGEQYLKTWNGLLDQNDVEVQDAYGKYEEDIKSGKAYSMAELQKQLPHIANALEYKDNPEDNRNRAMGLAPAGSKEYINSCFVEMNSSLKTEELYDKYPCLEEKFSYDPSNPIDMTLKDKGLTSKAFNEAMKNSTYLGRKLTVEELNIVYSEYDLDNADDVINILQKNPPKSLQVYDLSESYNESNRIEDHLPTATKKFIDERKDEYALEETAEKILKEDGEDGQRANELLHIIAENNQEGEISVTNYDPKIPDTVVTVQASVRNERYIEEFEELTGYTVEELTGVNEDCLGKLSLGSWLGDVDKQRQQKNFSEVYEDVVSKSKYNNEAELRDIVLDKSDFELYIEDSKRYDQLSSDVMDNIRGNGDREQGERDCISTAFEEYFGVAATESNMLAFEQRINSYNASSTTTPDNDQKAADMEFLKIAQEALYNYRVENQRYGDEWNYSNGVNTVKAVFANEKAVETLDQEYTAENYEFLSNNVDFAGTLGITGGHKEFEDTTFNTLRQAALDTQFLDSQQTYAVLNTELEKHYSATSRFYGYGTDPTMRDIREQLDSLGWKGEKESDNEEINSLLNQARYRTMQLMRDDQLAHEEFVKSLPSWLVAIGNGIDRGVNNIVDGLESLVLEVVKLPVSIFGSTEGIDEAIHQNALESQNADFIARAEVGMAKGATDFTMGLYEFTTVATEVGIMIAAGGAIGAAIGGSAGTALTGWKAVASKLILQPKMLPMFTSSLGRNLMEAELDGKSGWAKWGYALPAAYIEGVLEQSMGLFGSGRKLFTQGAKKLSLQTIKNAGIILSENVLWEGLVEENLQDISSMFIKNVAYGNNVLEGDYFNLERMDKTTKIAGAVGMFMTLMGAPRHFRSHTYAQRANVHLDSAVKALDAGNMQTARKEMSGFTQTLKKGAEYFDMEAAQGKFDQILRSKTLVSDQLSGVLQELKGATAEQVEQRQAMEKGKKVDSWYIENVKGRINDGMNKLRKAVGLAEVHLQNLINPWMNQGMVLQTAGNTVGVDNNWNMMQTSDTSSTAQTSSFTASVQSGQEANAGTSTNGTQNSTDGANTTPQTQNESSVTSSQNKSTNDLFVEYADVLGTDNMPSLAEFTAMREQGGKAWNELTQKVAFKQALDGGSIPPFTRFAEYKNTVDYIANSAPNVVALYGNDVNAAVGAVLEQMAETNMSVEDAIAGLLKVNGESIVLEEASVSEAQTQEINLKNIEEFVAGKKSFDEVAGDYAKIYAEKVHSNKPWSWNISFNGGDGLTAGQRKKIKEKAIADGLIPDIKVIKADGMRYGFADFNGAGVVVETTKLIENLWQKSDKDQFDWLDNSIGGRPEGMTWHHTEIPGKMELVPFGIHNITIHNGGRSPGMWADAPR